MSYKVETVLYNITMGCGEGPHWDDATQTLLFVDIDGGDIHRYDPATRRHEVLHLDGYVGFVVPRQKGGLVAGYNRTFSAVDWATKKVTKIAEVDLGTNNRMNDGKCDPTGRLWGGTMDIDLAPGKGSLYCLDADGTVKKQVENVSISNGLAWTSDAKTMYFIDTTPRKVYVYDFDNTTGNMSNRRVLVDFEKIPELQGVFPGPDGMTLDTNGNLWVACIGGGCLVKFHPQTGELLQRVMIPNATQITSACWGGKNHDELYVTSLRKNLSASDLKTKDSLAGSLFRVTGLGARGAPATIYLG